MNTPVFTPTLGPLGCLLPRLITKWILIFGLHSGGCWRHRCRWQYFPEFGILGHVSPFSEQTPVLKLSSRDRNMGTLPFYPHNMYLWHLILSQMPAFVIDEATITSIKWSRKHKKVHVILCLWFHRTEERYQRGGGGNLVHWGMKGVNTRISTEKRWHPKPINLSIFQQWGGNYTITVSLFFQGQNHVSYSFKNPKYPLDDEIEHENSIIVFMAEYCIKIY